MLLRTVVVRSILVPTALAVLIALGACGGAETRKARHLERGEAFFADKNYEKARVEFRNALQIAPNDAQARFLAGRVAERLKNPREAAGLYQGAIDADAKHVQARASLGRLYVFSGAPKKALELVEPTLATAEDADLLTVRAAARLQTGDVENALKDVTRARELDQNNENAIALLASIYRQTGRADEAVTLLSDAVKRRPENSDLRLVLAQLYLQKEDRAKAEAELKQIVALNPQQHSHRYQLAMFYLSGKNIDKAEQVLREAVKIAPQSSEPKLVLIDFLTQQRSRAAAEREYQAFIAREPKNAELRLGLGQFYERSVQAGKAELLYKQIIEQEKLSAQGLTARNRLAALKAQTGRLDEAGELIAQVLKENPRDNDALTLRGNIALSRDDAAAAVADFRAVLRDQPTAVGVLRTLARAHVQNNELALAEESLHSALEASPNNVDTRIDLAQLQAQRGQMPQALQTMERAVRDAPQNVAAREALFRVQLAARQWDVARRTAEDIKLLKPDLALGYFFAGLVAQAEQKPGQSAVEFKRALQLQPDATEPLTALVRAHLAQKQADEALKILEAQLERFPQNAIVRNLKGEVLLTQKRYGDAAASFKEAMQRAPQWWLPYRGLALTYLAQKDPAAAIETYSRGFRTTKEATPLALDLAALYERDGQTKEAIDVYEELVKRDPRSEMAANNLAMLLVTYRTDKQSLDRARDLVAPFAASTVPAYLNTYGWVKYKRGEVDAALPTLQQAVEKSPDSLVMRYHLGMAQYRAGKLAQAQYNLSRSLESGKQFAGSEEARTILEQLKKNAG